MWASFNRFEIEMTKAQAAGASHSGSCDDDVAALVNEPSIARQLRRIDPKSIRDELREYGAWDEIELTDEPQNQRRIVWIAAGNIVDSQS